MTALPSLNAPLPQASDQIASVENKKQTICVLFNDGYAIRKIVENMAETCKETIFYFTPTSIQCVCEKMYGDKVQSRLLVLTQHMPVGNYTYECKQEEVKLQVNLIEMYEKVKNVKLKIGRIRIVFSPDASGQITEYNLQTINSLSEIGASWEDNILQTYNVERTYSVVDDYTTPPLVEVKTPDLVKFFKELKSTPLSCVEFIPTKNGGICFRVMNKEGKYIKGKTFPNRAGSNPSVTGSTTGADELLLSGGKEISASPELAERWGRLTGFNDSKTFLNLSTEKPFSMVTTLDRFGWYMIWLR